MQSFLMRKSLPVILAKRKYKIKHKINFKQKKTTQEK